MKIRERTELLTLKEAADRLGMSFITLQQQARKGVLPTQRIGRQYVVTGEELQRYADEHRHKRGFASSSHPYHGQRPPARVERSEPVGWFENIEAEPPAPVEASAQTPATKPRKTRTTMYDPLAAYLTTRTEDSAVLSFAQIEEIIGHALPLSARKDTSHWGRGDHDARAIPAVRRAGWVPRLDVLHQCVRFTRKTADNGSDEKRDGDQPDRDADG